MKTLLFLLLFSFEISAISIDQKKAMPFGHSPIYTSYSINVVLPNINRELIKKYPTDEKRINDSSDQQLELLYATLSATVSLTPHFLIGYY